MKSNRNEYPMDWQKDPGRPRTAQAFYRVLHCGTCSEYMSLERAKRYARDREDSQIQDRNGFIRFISDGRRVKGI